jgi:PAP2 superfamily
VAGNSIRKNRRQLLEENKCRTHTSWSNPCIPRVLRHHFQSITLLLLRFSFALLLLLSGISVQVHAQDVALAAQGLSDRLNDSSVTLAAKSSIDTTHDSTLPRTSTTSNIDRRAEPGVFDLITNLPSDWRDWAVDNFQLKYWPQFSLIAVSTGALIVYDNQIWKPFEKEYNTNMTFQNLSNDFVDVGDGRFQFGLAVAFGGYGFIAGDQRAIRTASQVCEVILASGGVVQLLKHVTGRESPIDINTVTTNPTTHVTTTTTYPTGRWDWFPNQILYFDHTSHYDAFPSGHLTTALATLTVIANNYPEQTWIDPVGYAVCAGLSVGLVAQSVHWWSDFPLAIALGVGFGNLISPNPNGDVNVPQPSTKETGWVEAGIHSLLAETTIVPSVLPDGGGLAMVVKF